MRHLNKTLTITGIVLAALVLMAIQFMTWPAAPALSATPDVPSLLGESVGITWGPSYYDDDTIIAAERHRPELESMKQVDRHALDGKSWGPSYTGDTTIVAPGTNLNRNAAITWGPSYYDNDTIVGPERHRPALESMKQVDLNAMKGVIEGPAYHE